MSSYHGKCSFKSSRAFSNLRRLLLKKKTLKIRVYDNKINITFNKSIISVFNRDLRPILFLHTIYILLTTPFSLFKRSATDFRYANHAKNNYHRFDVFK